MSTFTIALPDTKEPKVYAKRDAAIKFVNKQALENGLALQVIDEDGNIAHVGNPVTDRYFHPFERLETPPSSLEAPAFPGFVPAYHRKRVLATVYRGQDEAGLKGTWRIYDGRSKNFVDVANTKDANEVTKGMKTAQL
jgi:hypothetical protein